MTDFPPLAALSSGPRLGRMLMNRVGLSSVVLITTFCSFSTLQTYLTSRLTAYLLSSATSFLPALLSLKNLDAFSTRLLIWTPHMSQSSLMTLVSVLRQSRVLSPATKYRRTTPSASFLELTILIHPTSPVLSQWVPQQASVSVSAMLTILSSLPGTTPP